MGKRLGQLFRDDRLWGWSGVRQFPRKHLVQHAGEAVLIAPTVEGATTRCLLRAHVARGADGEPSRGQALAARPPNSPRDPRTGNERVPAGQENVLRLDVPVGDIT